LVLASAINLFSLPQSAQASGSIADRILTDDQLDTVSASGENVTLELSASADGPAAVSTTRGQVASGRSTVLKVSYDPNAFPAARARLVDTVAADVILANGEADASGASNAQCSAKIMTTGSFAYFDQAQMQTVTPSSAVCACAAIGLRFGP